MDENFKVKAAPVDENNRPAESPIQKEAQRGQGVIDDLKDMVGNYSGREMQKVGDNFRDKYLKAELNLPGIKNPIKTELKPNGAKNTEVKVGYDEGNLSIRGGVEVDHKTGNTSTNVKAEWRF